VPVAKVATVHGNTTKLLETRKAVNEKLIHYSDNEKYRHRHTKMEASGFVCTKCNVSKPAEMFPNDKSRVDGIRKTCKECLHSKPLFDYSTFDPSASVLCKSCNITKTNADFYKDSKKSGGIRHPCKECLQPSIQKYHEANHEAVVQRKRERRLNPEVKAKERAYYKEYESRPEVLAMRKEYTNTEETKARMRKYREDHIEHLRELERKRRPIVNERKRTRYRTDHEYKMKVVLRSKIHKFLAGIPTSFEILLGCDLEFFRRWLEFRFDNEMNWDNFGSYWHIDHILPVSKFDFGDNRSMYICFHWTNLQPLVGSENQEKHAKIQLHYYYNNIVNVCRFNRVYNQFLGYQAVNESLRWLKNKDFRYGNNPPDVDA
jgi:hypothetical protein